jgi:hypothetical protein
MPNYDNIYDRLDAGKGAEGSVLDDISEMDMDEMMDYFADLDPVEFL